MGIHLACDNVSYSCGYGAWDTAREEIAHAAVTYLRSIYDYMLTGNLYNGFVEEEQAEVQVRIEKLLEYVEVNNCVTIRDFIQMLSDFDFQNIFILFDLGGVYALLNKSDDDGYYSVGNSYDIAHTLSIIDNYVIYDEVKRNYMYIKKVFDESRDTKKRVVIT